MTYFKCERCNEEFEIDPYQDEEAIERQYFGLYGFFPEDIPPENTVDVCQPCYETYLRWHYKQSKEQQEELTQLVADYYGVTAR